MTLILLLVVLGLAAIVLWVPQLRAVAGTVFGAGGVALGWLLGLPGAWWIIGGLALLFLIGRARTSVATSTGAAATVTSGVTGVANSVTGIVNAIHSLISGTLGGVATTVLWIYNNILMPVLESVGRLIFWTGFGICLIMLAWLLYYQYNGWSIPIALWWVVAFYFGLLVLGCLTAGRYRYAMLAITPLFFVVLVWGALQIGWIDLQFGRVRFSNALLKDQADAESVFHKNAEAAINDTVVGIYDTLGREIHKGAPDPAKANGDLAKLEAQKAIRAIAQRVNPLVATKSRSRIPHPDNLTLGAIALGLLTVAFIYRKHE
jgi:hypothetical protein